MPCGGATNNEALTIIMPGLLLSITSGEVLDTNPGAVQDLPT